MPTYKLCKGFRPGCYANGHMVVLTGNRLPQHVADRLLAAGVIESEATASAKPKATRRSKKGKK